MATRVLQYPTVVGVRLSEDDHHKLQQLSVSLHRLPGDVVRLLIRLAQPTNLPSVQFVAAASEAQGH